MGQVHPGYERKSCDNPNRAKPSNVSHPLNHSFRPLFCANSGTIETRFRWAALQIHELLKLRLEEEVNARLGKLPKDLKTTYDDIYLRQIKGRGEIESAIAERAIMWLLAAFEPLTSKHLLAAVRINAGPYNEMLLEPETDVSGQRGTPEAPHVQFVKGDIDEELLLELCANLLTLDAATGKWNFAHASVLEYFEAHHFSVVHAHAYVGFVSLMVIIDVAQSKTAYVPPGQSPNTKDGENEQEHEDQGPEYRKPSSNRAIYRSLFQHSLVVYTFGHWGNHMSLVDKGVNTLKAIRNRTFERDAHTIIEGLRILLQRFLAHPNNSSSEYRFWRNAFICWVEELGWPVLESILGMTLRDIYYGQATETYASFAAVHYGFFNMLPTWWQGSCDGHDRGTCPTCEAWPSIDTTATTEINGRSLVEIAAYFGHAHIVHALLSMGMSVNSGQNTAIWSPDPLCLAGEQGFLEVCRVLIKYCQPERPSRIDYALSLAAQGHHHHVVRYLLSAGADPNHQVPLLKTDETVLEIAARQNNIEFLRIIFEGNRDQPRAYVLSQSELVNAAFTAAFHLSLDALQWLVSDGHIDPNARYSDQRFETILLAAAHDISSWSNSVFRCLRKCGVDFNIQEDDLCRLRKSQQSFHHTLLEAVVLTGEMDLLQVAVEEWGEDVNAIFDDSFDSGYGCALITAVEEGHLEMVQYLLNKNADANCPVPKRERWNTPLSAALRGKHFSIANALIENGADINMPIKYGSFGSALVGAAWQRSVDALKFAINAGALIDAPLEYGCFGSALICATRYGRMANAQYLLDHGADINYQATIGEFPSALMAASFSRDEKMVSFLINRGADVNRPENHGWDTMLKRRSLRSVRYSSSWSSWTD